VSRSDLFYRIHVVEEGIVSRIVVLTALCSIYWADVGYAQSRTVVELESGGGYVFGSGAEDPGPSLPTFDAAIVVWPTERWGIAVRLVEGPGEDLHTPAESLDRTFLGAGHLHYWTATARHRRSISRDLGLEVGFGMMFDSKFGTIEMFRDPPRRVSVPNGPAYGFSLEALVTHPLARHFAVKAGVTYDFEFETNHFQPVALAVIRF
jgi:hypothetical protein